MKTLLTVDLAEFVGTLAWVVLGILSVCLSTGAVTWFALLSRHWNFVVDAFLATFWPWWGHKGFPILVHTWKYHRFLHMFQLASCTIYDTISIGQNIRKEKVWVYENYTLQCFWCCLNSHFPDTCPLWLVIVTLALPWLWPLPLCDFRESSSCFICWRVIK